VVRTRSGPLLRGDMVYPSSASPAEAAGAEGVAAGSAPAADDRRLRRKAATGGDMARGAAVVCLTTRVVCAAAAAAACGRACLGRSACMSESQRQSSTASLEARGACAFDDPFAHARGRWDIRDGDDPLPLSALVSVSLYLLGTARWAPRHGHHCSATYVFWPL
jgi:hypothetical protein